MLMRVTETASRKPLSRSPSGLFTRRSWEIDLQDMYDEQRPVWSGGHGDSDRQFALWVHDQAKRLASQLDLLIQPDTAPRLARQLEAITEVLWMDAEWARRQVDGSFGEAA